VLGFEYLNRTDLAHVIQEAPTGELMRRPHATDIPVGREHQSKGDGRPQMVAVARNRPASDSEESGTSAMTQQNKRLLGDAPACDACGHITIRNGTCYKCVNCGTSMGCS